MNIYLRELGITVCITLIASLFISQTLIPMATSWFIRSKPKPRGRLMTWVEDHYVRLLKFNLRHRWLTPVIGTVVVAGSVYPFMKIDKNLGGSEAEMFVQVGYEFSENLSLQKKEAVITQVEKVLEPHREEFKARSIYSFWSDDEWSLTRVYPREGETSPENMAAIRRKLQEVLPEIPGVKLEVQENKQFWGGGPRKQIWFQIVGEDSEVARVARRRGEAPPRRDTGSRRSAVEQRARRRRRSTSSSTASSPRATASRRRSPPRSSGSRTAASGSSASARRTASARCVSRSTRRKPIRKISSPTSRSGRRRGRRSRSRRSPTSRSIPRRNGSSATNG